MLASMKSYIVAPAEVRPTASAPSSSGESAGTRLGIPWTDLDADPPLMKRSVDGETEDGILKQGTNADGMATVTWPDGSVETTDVPNLLVVPSKKRPAADAVLKRPAKIQRPSAPLSYSQVLARPDIDLEHLVLYYKKPHQIGIRQKKRFGGKQLLSFGGRACSATEQELRAVGIEVCKKLADGVSIARAREWAQESVA